MKTRLTATIMPVQVRTCSMHVWMRGRCAARHRVPFVYRRTPWHGHGYARSRSRDRKLEGQIRSQHMPLRSFVQIVGIYDSVEPVGRNVLWWTWIHVVSACCIAERCTCTIPQPHMLLTRSGMYTKRFWSYSAEGCMYSVGSRAIRSCSLWLLLYYGLKFWDLRRENEVVA
jgi:hypothetical protein